MNVLWPLYASALKQHQYLISATSGLLYVTLMTQLCAQLSGPQFMNLICDTRSSKCTTIASAYCPLVQCQAPSRREANKKKNELSGVHATISWSCRTTAVCCSIAQGMWMLSKCHALWHEPRSVSTPNLGNERSTQDFNCYIAWPI